MPVGVAFGTWHIARSPLSSSTLRKYPHIALLPVGLECIGNGVFSELEAPPSIDDRCWAVVPNEKDSSVEEGVRDLGVDVSVEGDKRRGRKLYRYMAEPKQHLTEETNTCVNITMNGLQYNVKVNVLPV